LKGKHPQHYRHHPEHHVLTGLLPGIHGRCGGHLLLDPGGGAHQQGDNKQEEAGVGRQVQANEFVVQRRRGVHLVKRHPGIQARGQIHQVVRVAVKSLNQYLEQAKQDGHLDYHGPQTTNGAYAGLFIEPHGLLRHAGTVLAVLFLKFLKL